MGGGGGEGRGGGRGLFGVPHTEQPQPCPWALAALIFHPVIARFSDTVMLRERGLSCMGQRVTGHGPTGCGRRCSRASRPTRSSSRWTQGRGHVYMYGRVRVRSLRECMEVGHSLSRVAQGCAGLGAAVSYLLDQPHYARFASLPPIELTSQSHHILHESRRYPLIIPNSQPGVQRADGLSLSPIATHICSLVRSSPYPSTISKPLQVVSNELIELMGGGAGAKDLEPGFPQVILMAGLQVCM